MKWSLNFGIGVETLVVPPTTVLLTFICVNRGQLFGQCIVSLNCGVSHCLCGFSWRRDSLTYPDQESKYRSPLRFVCWLVRSFVSSSLGFDLHSCGQWWHRRINLPFDKLTNRLHSLRKNRIVYFLVLWMAVARFGSAPNISFNISRPLFCVL